MSYVIWMSNVFLKNLIFMKICQEKIFIVLINRYFKSFKISLLNVWRKLNLWKMLIWKNFILWKELVAELEFQKLSKLSYNVLVFNNWVKHLMPVSLYQEGVQYKQQCYPQDIKWQNIKSKKIVNIQWIYYLIMKVRKRLKKRYLNHRLILIKFSVLISNKWHHWQLN